MDNNPYAKFLGEQDARAVMAATPGLVHQAVCALTPEQVEAPIAPGKWSPRVIVAHLADCEYAFGWRLRQALAVEKPVVQPFDQDAWSQRYAGYDLPSALELLRASRAWNMKLIGTLSQADLQREMTHPERGTMTFLDVLKMMAGHDLNHLGQLQALARGKASEALSLISREERGMLGWNLVFGKTVRVRRYRVTVSAESKAKRVRSHWDETALGRWAEFMEAQVRRPARCFGLHSTSRGELKSVSARRFKRRGKLPDNLVPALSGRTRASGVRSARHAAERMEIPSRVGPAGSAGCVGDAVLVLGEPGGGG